VLPVLSLMPELPVLITARNSVSIHGLGHGEVLNFDLVLLSHLDVFGFKVAVNDVVFVDGFERDCHKTLGVRSLSGGRAVVEAVA